jgi:hypothetical protein
MLAGVAAWRIVTTKRRAAILACSQVNPFRANLHALFAFAALWMFDCPDSSEM